MDGRLHGAFRHPQALYALMDKTARTFQTRRMSEVLVFITILFPPNVQRIRAPTLYNGRERLKLSNILNNFQMFFSAASANESARFWSTPVFRRFC